MRLQDVRSAFLLCGLLLIPASALAGPPNGCVGLYDPAARGGAKDVYVSVERSDETAACFLIPRAVIVEKFRLAYSDSMAAPLLMLDQASLRSYLDGRESVTVGAEERPVAPETRDCLAQPTFDAILIASGFEFRPTTMATVTTFAKAAESDLPGYRRLTTDLHDYYWSEADPQSPIPIMCWRSLHPDDCSVLSDYDKSSIALQFRKAEIANMLPKESLQCVRDIADLFKVTKPVEAQ